MVRRDCTPDSQDTIWEPRKGIKDPNGRSAKSSTGYEHVHAQTHNTRHGPAAVRTTGPRKLGDKQKPGRQLSITLTSDEDETWRHHRTSHRSSEDDAPDGSPTVIGTD